MNSRHSLGLLSLAVASWLALATPARGLEIREVRWGFDGSVVEGAFNPVSLLVVNDQSTPFDGVLALQRGHAALRVDAPLREPVYLGPNQSRWVQFFPFCSRVEDALPWTVSWGDARKERFELPTAQRGQRGTVLLLPQGTLTQPPSGAKPLPDDLFPNRSTGCDSLQRVVLDHEPRWSEPQQRAFLEWLALGGELHLLHDSQGRWPRFSGPLQPLQGLADMQPFAAGRIIRHDRDVNSFDKGSWAGAILGQVETVNPELTPDVAAMASNAVVTPGLEPFTSDDWEQFDTDTMLDRMRDQTRTDHNWPLIHLLCLTYIGLIFPGGWLLSRWRPGDYRLLFGGLLGLVTLFSLLLLVVGRRGAGEVETIHSLLLARTLDKERVSVSGWSGAFVATSGTYPLSHAGQGGLYSTGQQIEGVDGFITTQPPARLEVTLPPFSSRSFVHRVNTPDELGRWQIVDLASGTASRDVPRLEQDPLKQLYVVDRPEQIPTLTRLTVRRIGGNQPSPKEVLVVSDRWVYSLVRQGGTDDEWSLATSPSKSLWAAAREQGDFNMTGLSPWGPPAVSPARESIFATVPRELLRQALRIPDSKTLLNFRLPEKRICLLAWFPLPTELKLAGDDFSSQYGGCLLIQDLWTEDAQ